MECIFVYWNSYAVASGIGVVACKNLYVGEGLCARICVQHVSVEDGDVNDGGMEQV